MSGGSRRGWLRAAGFFRDDGESAGGRRQVALVVHLLAPNQRPVQMTTDLAGFWERLYPQLRRELGRSIRGMRGRRIRL